LPTYPQLEVSNQVCLVQAHKVKVKVNPRLRNLNWVNLKLLNPRLLNLKVFNLKLLNRKLLNLRLLNLK
jgi:hypothetical protein